MAQISWKSGRGKLGILLPLLGNWKTQAEMEFGDVTCFRSYSFTLDRKYVQLDAHWLYGADKHYDEHCLFGVDSDRTIHFWSFTSDGKRSTGWLSNAPDVHPKALCFEADMDAGRARQIYWPHEETGFYWAVESRTKKGWNRFALHHYRAE